LSSLLPHSFSRSPSWDPSLQTSAPQLSPPHPSPVRLGEGGLPASACDWGPAGPLACGYVPAPALGDLAKCPHPALAGPQLPHCLLGCSGADDLGARRLCGHFLSLLVGTVHWSRTMLRGDCLASPLGQWGWARCGRHGLPERLPGCLPSHTYAGPQVHPHTRAGHWGCSKRRRHRPAGRTGGRAGDEPRACAC
jgi:hypothetical protein